MKKKSKGIALNIKTKIIEIHINFGIDHSVVADFVKLYRKYFLKKNLTNDLTNSSKKIFAPKTKTHANSSQQSEN